MSPAPSDPELVLQLLDDVGILEAQFTAGIPQPAATRAIFAPILRRWIAEALFFKAQKLIMPHQIGFAITNNARAVELCKAGVYERWLGLVVFGTVGVATARVAPEHLGPDGRPVTPLSDDSNSPPESQKASTFFNQKMVFWKGRLYTRADIIKMHANTLGGVHFDFPQTDDEAYICEIKNCFGFEVKGTNNQILIGDDIQQGRADPTRRKWIYDATELIAMDTARIFASGVRASEQAFLALPTSAN